MCPSLNRFPNRLDQKIYIFASRYIKGRFLGRYKTSKTLQSYDIKDIRKIFLHVKEKEI